MTLSPSEQLAQELADRLAPFDQLAKAAGLGRPFTGQLDTLPVDDLADNLTTATARAVLGALWPGGAPSQWWQTPLGRAVAGPLADTTPEAEVVTVAEAGRMLGIGHSRVNQLANDGWLQRTEGGLTLASVYARVARPGRSGRPGWRNDPDSSPK